MENPTGKQATTPSGTFEGFTPPTRNYFMMPNEWTDITSEIESLAELKCVEYVLRHTWGFHEFGICKTISIDEFMYGRKHKDGSRMDKGTGLKSDRSVRDGLKLAIEHGYLVCVVDDSDKARIKKSYALKMSNQQHLPSRVVESTRGKSGSIHQSAPTILPVQAPVVSTTRSEKETLERHLQKERETPPVPPASPQPNSPSLPPEKSSSFLDKLTDEQADFWTRWRALSGTQKLTDTSYGYIISLASKVTTTQALQSLYDYSYEQVNEIAQAAGRKTTPPNLGTLNRYLTEWEKSQAREQRGKEQEQTAHEHIPGSGSITNWTQARLAGNQPAINYEPLPPVRKVPNDLKKVGNVTSTLSVGLQERIRLAREKRQTDA